MLTPGRVFVKVAELGSFSKAANVLNMAPSSVTQSINTLEHDLQVTLFKRSTCQLLLTDKGRLFLDGVSRLIHDADSLSASLKIERPEPDGVLRLSVFESFGRIHVFPLLPAFLKKYPNVNVEIELGNNAAEFLDEDIDIAIRAGKPTDSRLKARNLLSNKALVCASSKYLAVNGYPKEPDDLLAHNCLLLNQGGQRAFWYFHKGGRNIRVPVNGNMVSTGGTPLLEAALSGVGVVQLSGWAVSEYVKSGHLDVCLTDWEPGLGEADEASDNIYAVYKEAPYTNPAIGAFIDFLVDAIKEKAL